MMKRLFGNASMKRSLVSSNVRTPRSMLENKLLSATYGPAVVLYGGVARGDGFPECSPNGVTTS